MDKINDMSIKEMLASGDFTPSDLKALLEEEITKAQNELDYEQKQKELETKKAEKLEEARKNVIAATIDYANALGVTEINYTEEDLEEIVELLKINEKEMFKSLSIFDSIKDLTYGKKEKEPKRGNCTVTLHKANDGPSIDDIIKEFLDQLK